MGLDRIDYTVRRAEAIESKRRNGKMTAAPLDHAEPQQQQQQQPSPSSSSSQIRAIIFDLDGTLLDTERLADKALILAFGDAIPSSVLDGESDLSNRRLPWELKKRILGLRGKEWAPIVTSYAKEHWNVTDPPTHDELWRRWEFHLNAMCGDVEECAGAKKLVEKFARLKLPMAIATSSRRDNFEKKRSRHEDMFRHISTIVTGDDPRVKAGKPAPDIY